MKRICLSSLLFCVFIYACQKDATIDRKNYPFIITKQVSNIDSTGVTFKAEILQPGNKEIIDYGFTWSDGNNDFEISLKDNKSINNFKTRVSTDIKKGVDYKCRAYAKTSDNLILANEVSFQGLGSKKPIIYDFTPKQGFDKTKIVLSGKYFSQNSYNNKIYINNVRANKYYSNSDTIIFESPKMSFYGEADIKIDINSTEVIADNKFKILGPKITDISSLSGYSGDYLNIKGQYLTNNGAETNVLFGEYLAEIINYTDNEINLIIPSPINNLFSDNTLSIELQNGLKSTIFENSFIIKQSWNKKKPPTISINRSEEPFTYNGKCYFLEDNSKSFYEYDPKTNQWSSLPNTVFPGDKYKGSLYIVSGNKLFRVSGHNYLNQLLNVLWIFDFDTNKWTRVDHVFPFSFLKATYFYLNEKFFIVTDRGEVWKCDFNSESYTRLNNFPSSFEYSFAASFISNDTAYISTYGNTYQYNEKLDSWSFIATNPFSSSYYTSIPVGFTFNNKGYVLNRGYKLYKFDNINKEWILTTLCPGMEEYIAAFVINNEAFFASSSLTGMNAKLYSYR